MMVKRATTGLVAKPPFMLAEPEHEFALDEVKIKRQTRGSRKEAAVFGPSHIRFCHVIQ